MNEDMSNLMNQINNMIQNNEIPDEIRNMIGNMTKHSDSNTTADTNTNSTSHSNEDVSSSDCTTSNSSIPDFDIGTMMKMKGVMDALKSNKDDPRANLLKSLKPYLKESRKEKVDQYIQLLGMEKVLGMMGSSLNGGGHK